MLDGEGVDEALDQVLEGVREGATKCSIQCSTEGEPTKCSTEEGATICSIKCPIRRPADCGADERHHIHLDGQADRAIITHA